MARPGERRGVGRRFPGCIEPELDNRGVVNSRREVAGPAPGLPALGKCPQEFDLSNSARLSRPFRPLGRCSNCSPDLLSGSNRSRLPSFDPIPSGRTESTNPFEIHLQDAGDLRRFGRFCSEIVGHSMLTVFLSVVTLRGSPRYTGQRLFG